MTGELANQEKEARHCKPISPSQTSEGENCTRSSAMQWENKVSMKFTERITMYKDKAIFNFVKIKSTQNEEKRNVSIIQIKTLMNSRKLRGED